MSSPAGAYRYQWRVTSYAIGLRDEYPPFEFEFEFSAEDTGTDAGILEVERPGELGRFMPLVKWFLAIPHYLVLIVLGIAALVAVIVAWFAILATGTYPRGLFHFVEGVLRWQNRVTGYAITLVTDRYPPFRLAP